jgi:hypothetical protein
MAVEKKVQRALDQVRWFAHALSSVTEGMIHKLPSVSKGKRFGGGELGRRAMDRPVNPEDIACFVGKIETRRG